MNLFTYCNNNPVMYLDGDGNFAISTLAICAIIGACIGFGTAAYVDSKDGQMFNGDVKWYDYLGATALGGLAGAGIGYALPSLSTFASSSFSISSGLLMSGEGAALSIGIAITGVQVLEGIGALGGAISGAGASNSANIGKNMVGLSDDGIRAITAITNAANRKVAGTITAKGFQGTLNLYGKTAFNAVQAAVPGTMRKLFLSSALKIALFTPVASGVQGGLNYGYKVLELI